MTRKDPLQELLKTNAPSVPDAPAGELNLLLARIREESRPRESWFAAISRILVPALSAAGILLAFDRIEPKTLPELNVATEEFVIESFDIFEADEDWPLLSLLD